MKTRVLAALVAIMSLVLVGAAFAKSTSKPTPKPTVKVTKKATPAPTSSETTISITTPRYDINKSAGSNDDYHCSLIDPKITKPGYLTSIAFTPGNATIAHHAILFRVPASQAQAARIKDAGGKGWTCFGGPGVGSAFDGDAWLSAWAPGAGSDKLPTNTGVPVSAGDLIVLQMHYNLLRANDSDRTDQSAIKMQFTTKPLIPLTNSLFAAPVNLPCPEGVTGPLCDRAASLKETAQRFGSQALFAQALEFICGRGATGPKIGNETDCSRVVPEGGLIRRVSAHMHMLGRSLTLTINPGKPNEQVIFEEKNYNFDNQRAVALQTPYQLKPGDTVKVSCTYDPKLRTLLPELKSLPPRFVTWGEGSSDEMCLAVVQISPR